MQDVGGYRLVWFQHLHKAAGTVIINMAKANQEILYNPNNNANPVNNSGNTLPLWQYDEIELKNFIDKCEKEGVTFVASEFGAPDFKILADDSRIRLMTCFRDPEKRLISNHNYDYYSGYTESKKVSEFIKKPNIFTSDNYYVRIFSRMDEYPSIDLNEENYNLAINNISKFDILINTESDNIEEKLENSLGWKRVKVDQHGTFGDKWKIINMFKKFQIRKLIKYIRKESADTDILSLENKYKLDYRLMRQIFDN